MLDMNFLGGLHGVAIGVMDVKSIKIFGLGPKTRVPTLPPLPGHRTAPGVGTLAHGPNPNFLIDLWLLSPMATPRNPSKLSDKISILTSPPN